MKQLLISLKKIEVKFIGFDPSFKGNPNSKVLLGDTLFICHIVTWAIFPFLEILALLNVFKEIIFFCNKHHKVLFIFHHTGIPEK